MLLMNWSAIWMPDTILSEPQASCRQAEAWLGFEERDRVLSTHGAPGWQLIQGRAGKVTGEPGSACPGKKEWNEGEPFRSFFVSPSSALDA